MYGIEDMYTRLVGIYFWENKQHTIRCDSYIGVD